MSCGPNIVWSSAREPELNEALGNWCAAHIGLPRGFRDHSCMGVFKEEKPVAVMVFNNFQPEAGVLEIHGAAETPRWLSRPVLYQMFSYPFDQLGCQAVVMRVSEHDTRLLRILTAYGFDSIIIPRLRGREEGERIFWLTDDAWRSNRFHKENSVGESCT